MDPNAEDQIPQIPEDILDLPDDQAMEAIAAAGPIADAEPVQVVDHDETQQPAAQVTDAGDGTAAKVDDTGEAGGDKTGSEDAGAGGGEEKPPVKTDDKPAPTEDKTGDDKKPEGEKPTEVQPEAPKALSTYSNEEKVKAFDELFAGGKLRANGKDIEIRSPEELKRLAQMGANYTQKMQKLQPKVRALTMLENNGLLDENQLAFAIDLLKKEPSAIQKLLADAQFDPMSADKDKAAEYQPGAHHVSDAEMKFNQALDDVAETATGPELLSDVQGKWDQESKKWLFQNPDMLQTLNQQKASGVYKLITDEMDRLQALGQIPQGTPFLQAYRGVGDFLDKQGAFKELAKPKQDQDQPVETRVATPAPAVKNDEKAQAAAPTKAAPAAAERDDSGVLGLSDDEFMKQMAGRL